MTFTLDQIFMGPVKTVCVISYELPLLLRMPQTIWKLCPASSPGDPRGALGQTCSRVMAQF